MNIAESILLGLVQGLTEFIPVSSSGHLIVVREIFGIEGSMDLSVDAVLQLATVLAVLVYFRRDLWNILKSFLRLILMKPINTKEKTLLLAILLGTIPALFLGLILESRMETAFRSSYLVALALIIGSILMYIAEKVGKKNSELSVKKGFLIGIFQSLALIPGISRSGATISGGLLQGLTREEATRFSFLLSFPIILGSGLKKLFDLGESHLSALDLPLLIAFLVSFIVGLISIRFLIRYVKTHTLKVFIWYRIILAIIILFVASVT